MKTTQLDAIARAPISIRISEEAATRARTEADTLGVNLGKYIEMLILQRGLTHTDYFAQQAAIQSFIAAGLIIGIAVKQVGPEKATELRRQAVQAAEGLFGPVRERPFGLDDRAPPEDPRIAALFAAFGAG